jgi:hypothetical protein
MIEIMVAAAILALVGGVLLALTNGALGSWQSGTSVAYANNSASTALQKLASEIRDGAGASVASTDGSKLAVVFPGTLQDPVTHDTLYDPSQARQTRYYFVMKPPGQTVDCLVRSLDGATCNAILARGVSRTDFTGTTAGFVQAAITASEQVGKVLTQKTRQARIALRNYRPE